MPILLAALLSATTAPAQVRIQEILYDGPSTDDDDVFTEIIGPPGTSLSGWTLVGVNGSSGSPYRTVSLGGAAIPDDGVLVVAHADAASALAAVRDVTGDVDWQNGPDAVQLVDADGAIVDAVQYGDAGTHNAGEGAPAIEVASGHSLARDDEGSDTDDNGADFAEQETPSPGIGPLVVDAGTGGAGGGGSPPDTTDGTGTSPDSTGTGADTPADSGAAVVTVSLPDTTSTGGDTLTVPVRFTQTTGLGLLAAEMSLTFDPAVLNWVDAISADLVDSLSWTLLANVRSGTDDSPDTVRLALATDIDTLVGAGSLVHVRFVVADPRQPAASVLGIEGLDLNDGTMEAGTAAGGVRLVGTDAALRVSPNPLQMHEPLHLVVEDRDEDRDPFAVDSVLVRLNEGPEAAPGSQVEWIRAFETGASTGSFAATVTTVYASGVSANGILEIQPRHTLTACYEDLLDEAGATTSRCDSATVLAHDGHLDATMVAQPGDTLWLRVVDADLDLRPDALDTARVVIAAPATGDSVVASLVEIAPRDSVFHGFAATTPASGDTSASAEVLRVADTDSIVTSYLDRTPRAGDSAAVPAHTRVLPLFADVDGNGQRQAFDAARVLAHVLSPQLAMPESLAANVDSLAPFGALTPFDAALILQERVGLRDRFPVQTSSARNHPAASAPPPPLPPAARLAGTPAAGTPRHLSLRQDDGALTLWCDERAGLIAGDLLLEGPGLAAATPEPAADLAGFLVRAAGPGFPTGTHRVVWAGPVSPAGPGPLLRWTGLQDTAGARLLRARLNDGRVAAAWTGQDLAATARPDLPSLGRSYPNPFNGGIAIPYHLPGPSRVRLDIYSVLGHRVASLLTGARPAGPGRVTWDGRTDTGAPAATGVYVVHLKAGDRSLTRRILLAR